MATIPAMPQIVRSIPTRFFLILIILALVGPGLAFTGVLLWRIASSEQARTEQEAREIARIMATSIDQDLRSFIVALQSASTSTRLAGGDLSGFRAQLREVKTFIGADIELRSIEGERLISTGAERGARPERTALDSDAAVLEMRAPQVSGVYIDEASGVKSYAVTIPIIVNDAVHYLLTAAAPTERIARLSRLNLAHNWVIGVGDREGDYVSRSDRHEEFTGTPGIPAFISQVRGREGTFRGYNPSGGEILVGYARSNLSSWFVAASVPADIIEAPARRQLWNFVAFGAAALALSMLVAFRLWRQVAGPLQALSTASKAIARGEVMPFIASPVTEVRQLSYVLTAATSELRQSIDREKSTQQDLLSLAETLEERVEDRTAKLHAAHTALLAEMRTREAAETQLRQLQKMEAVGQLTGGIAHDFNNMLAIIIGGLSLVRRRLDKGDANVSKLIEASEEAAGRAAKLVERLLAFSRQQPLSPQPIDCNKLVASVSELLRPTLGETIRIETVLAGGLWRAYADPSQLENAILNLAVNARDAMPDGGRLTIETGNAYLDDDYARRNAVSAGQYAMIVLSDTGTGMTGDVLARAFDPFFTTKGVGKGTGLGLSQVYGFVKQSSGHVQIYSEVGVGTSVKIYLPRHQGEVLEAPSARPDPAPAGGGYERILVVEDEGSVREVSVAALQHLGYRVIQAPSAPAALELLDSHPDIALLFTDIVMPDMNGRKLADEALLRRPDLKVLYTTGFTRNAVVHNGVLDQGVNFLAKPFTLEQLALKVREVLDRTPPGAGPLRE